jgi:hypothetical protein
MSRVETPAYEVIESEGRFELRVYEPMIIAQVEVVGERRNAINEGFRMLADYIFGNNSQQSEIAMTAPVQQHEGSKIAMTAPVQQQGDGDVWQVSFVMPSQYTIDTIPLPNNSNVALVEMPNQTFAVRKFSGRSTQLNIKRHENELLEYVRDQGWETIGTPKYAFYNPPWTLPFMRRNEIMIQILNQSA